MVLKIQPKHGKKPIVLFSYIPRTGGTWIREVLDGLGLYYRFWKHGLRPNLAMAHTLLSTHYRKPAADEVDFIFSFVRNPFTWYESTWRILHEERWRTRTARYDWHPHKTAAMIWHPDFNVWLTRMVNTEPSLYTRLVELYIGPEGESYCDYVGKFENLYHDTAEMLQLSKVMSENPFLERRIRSDFSKPVNASKRVPIEWSNENRDAIHQSEVPILRRFYTSQ